MEAIFSRENMMEAYHRVVSNKGAAGVDRDDRRAVEALSWWSTGRTSKKNCWQVGINRRRCAGWKSPSPAAKGCGF